MSDPENVRTKKGRRNPLATMAPLFAVLVLSLCLAPVARAQEGEAPSAQRTRPAAQAPRTEDDDLLAAGSRRAIMDAAGFSADYFDRHFSLARVVNSPGDRRVVWRFKLGEYETVVNDPVGFYLDEGGRQVYVHAAAAQFACAGETARVIPRDRAEQLMRECVGEFRGAAVVFQPHGAASRPALVLVATSGPPAVRKTSPSLKEGSVAPLVTNASREDVPRQGGTKPPPLNVGAVNLETGECARGIAHAGSPPQAGP